MAWFRRIALFLLVNFLVMVTLSITMNLLGIGPYLTARGIDYTSLMVFCVFWGFGGAFISLMLSKTMVKWSMGVKIIPPENPSGPEQEWLLKTVHKLAQEAGLKSMPEVGMYESPDPNAFATGFGRESSLVCVSTGLFQHMGKDEMEGVLGHELTHVTNGDMVTMTLLQGVINAFVMFLARVIAFVVARDRRSSYMTRYFLTMALEIVLSLFGMIVVMAFSRWREYRADAGGARLAGRYKMINALRALQRAQEHLIPTQEPKSVQAFKISSRDGWMFLFASHPPLEKRIERLENTSDVVGA